jgi:hypothetical protein
MKCTYVTIDLLALQLLRHPVTVLMEGGGAPGTVHHRDTRMEEAHLTICHLVLRMRLHGVVVEDLL